MRDQVRVVGAGIVAALTIGVAVAVLLALRSDDPAVVTGGPESGSDDTAQTEATDDAATDDLPGVHVTPDGDGDGTAGSPASLAAVASGDVAVAPGTTVWLHDGTYLGSFELHQGGAEGEPVVYRSYPGERAVLDGGDGTGAADDQGVIEVWADWVEVRDVEVLVSDTQRLPFRRTGVDLLGDHVALIDSLVHDTGNGVRSFTDSSDVVIYGNVIYNCGVRGAEPYGHCMYLANASGSTKVVEDNVWFGGARQGLQVYTTNGTTVGFEIRGNMGIATEGDIVGGLQPIDDTVIADNDFEYLRLGYESDNGAIVLTGNHLGWGGERAFYVVDDWASITFRDNTVYGGIAGIRFDGGAALVPVAASDWDANTYHATMFALSTPGTSNCCGSDFATWQASTGWDATSTWSAELPATDVRIRPNRYEPGRALVAVDNWTNQVSVRIDPSSFLEPGAVYTVTNAFDPTAPPLATGTWRSGVISLPLTGLTQAVPIGDTPVTENPAPRHAAFTVSTIPPAEPTSAAVDG
jgi:hypothetical protein